MSFTETTRTSWFARLKNGVIGIFIGLLLVFGMIWLLAWNEGRSVKTYRALVEGAGAVVDIDSGAVEAGNEGKLVHIASRVEPVGTPADSQLGISAKGAAGLRRSVEMYQWVEEKKSETRKTLGGGEETVTTYSYTKEWRSDRADFSRLPRRQRASEPGNADLKRAVHRRPRDARCVFRQRQGRCRSRPRQPRANGGH